MTNYKLTDAIASTDNETKMWKSRFSLAKAAYGEGNFKECRSLLYRALEQGQKLKEHDFAVNTCLVGLAAADIAENKLDEAQKHLEKAIHALSVSTEPALRELYGVALRFNAHAMFLKGQTNPAREEIRKAAEVLEAIGPEGGVQLAYTLSDMAILHVTQGELKEAKDLILSSMDLLETALGPDNPEYMRANMIYNVSEAKDEAEMLSSIENSIVKMQYQRGSKHPGIVRAVRWYLKKLHDRGDKALIAEAEDKFDIQTKH